MAPYGSPWANIFLKLSQLKNVRGRFLPLEWPDKPLCRCGVCLVASVGDFVGSCGGFYPSNGLISHCVGAGCV